MLNQSVSKVGKSAPGRAGHPGISEELKQALDEAREFLKEKRFDEANSAFKAILEQNPDTLQAHIGIGNVYAGQDENEKALACYATALENKEDFAPALMMTGRVQAKMGDLDKALETFNVALEKSPNTEKVRLNIASIYVKQDKHDLALETMYDALRYNPQSEEVLLGIASALQRHGDIEEALKVFNTLFIYNPQSWKAYAQLGRLHLGQKQYDEAIAACNKSISLRDDDSASSHMLLGKSYVGAGQLDSALEAFNAALAIDEKLIGARIGIAQVYKEKGKLAEAKKALIELSKQRGPQGYVHILLAEVMADEGHFDLAVAQYQAAVLNSEKMVEKYPDLARVEIVEGDAEKTVEAFRKAFEVIDQEKMNEA